MCRRKVHSNDWEELKTFQAMTLNHIWQVDIIRNKTQQRNAEYKIQNTEYTRRITCSDNFVSKKKKEGALSIGHFVSKIAFNEPTARNTRNTAGIRLCRAPGGTLNLIYMLLSVIVRIKKLRTYYYFSLTTFVIYCRL